MRLGSFEGRLVDRHTSLCPNQIAIVAHARVGCLWWCSPAAC